MLRPLDYELRGAVLFKGSLMLMHGAWKSSIGHVYGHIAPVGIKVSVIESKLAVSF